MWWWRSAIWTTPPGTRMTAMAERALTLRAHGGPGEGYLVVLAARPQGEDLPELTVEGDETVDVRSARGDCHLQVRRREREWRVRGKAGSRRLDVEIPFPPKEGAR